MDLYVEKSISITQHNTSNSHLDSLDFETQT